MDAPHDCDVIHAEILSLARRGAAHEHALVRALLRAHRGAIWQQLNAATFCSYTKRYLGLSRRQTKDRLRVGRALERLPLLDANLAEGRLHFSVVRELTRVATPETEAAWVDAAGEKTSREVQLLVSGHLIGDLPDPAPPPEPRRHRVVLELSGDAYDLYREAQRKLRREGGDSFRDEDGLILMARAILGGAPDVACAPAPIGTDVSPSQAEEETPGRAFPVEPEAFEGSSYEPQPMGSPEAKTQDVAAGTWRLDVARPHSRCAVPGCRRAVFGEIRDLTLRSQTDPRGPDRPVLLCTSHQMALQHGALCIEGSWSTGIRYLHADGRAYGGITMLDDVHVALRDPGLHAQSAADARSAMTDELRTDTGPETRAFDEVRDGGNRRGRTREPTLSAGG